MLTRLCFLLLASLFFFPKETRAAENPPSGSYYMLLGLSSGYTRYYPEDTVFIGIHGQSTSARLVNTGYFKYWVFDWAIGVDFTALLQGALDGYTRRGGMGLVVEIASRWRFGRLGNWQIGPLFRLTVANDPTWAINEAAQQYFLFTAGPQFIYDIPFHKRYLFRVGTTFFVDFNVPSRRIMGFNIEGQIGTRSKYYSEIPAGTEEDEIDSRLLPEEEDTGKDFVRLTLKSEYLRFGPAQTELDNESKRYLYSVSYFLNQNPDAWQWVEVHGHSDQTGTAYGNYRLSQERSLAVRNALIEAGIPARKLRVVAKSDMEPRVGSMDKDAHQFNRRVELVFRGIQDEGFFRRGLRRARLRVERRLLKNAPPPQSQNEGAPQEELQDF